MNALQRTTAELWMALALQNACASGTLALAEQTSDISLAFALACFGLGGTCLLISPTKDAARAASRTGAVDFTVDSLPEALRILKNELRQRRSIGVALIGPAERYARQMLERGVQPQFLGSDGQGFKCQSTFVARGARDLALRELEAKASSDVSQHGLTIARHTAATQAERREEDLRLRKVFPATVSGAAQHAARQWIIAAPRLFPRDCERIFWQQDESKDSE